MGHAPFEGSPWQALRLMEPFGMGNEGLWENLHLFLEFMAIAIGQTPWLLRPATLPRSPAAYDRKRQEVA